MAKATAICTCEICGETFIKTAIKNNRRAADSWTDWAVHNFTVCGDCEQKQREAKAAALAEKAQEDGLPALTGTRKQCTWAEQIRDLFIQESERTMDAWIKQADADPEVNEYIRMLTLTREYILHTFSQARQWIDRRNVDHMSLITEIWRTQQLDIESASAEEEKPAAAKENSEEPAIDETVMVPENQQYGIVSVTVDGDSAYATYAKDDVFRTKIKAAGFTWVSATSRWYAGSSRVNGTAIDRAAEAIANLLRSGFAVSCDCAEARERALSGDYITWSSNVILLCICGSYTGWIIIKLPRYSDPNRSMIYSAARKIKGSVYSDGDILVPLAQYRSVLDFADLYGYRISPSVDEAWKSYDNDHHAHVAPAEKKVQEINPQAKLQEILKSSDEVLADLEDDDAPND